MPLDPAIKTMLDALAANPVPAFEEMEPEQARTFFEQSSTAIPPAEEIELPVVENRTIPGPAGEIPVRVYRPQSGGTLAVLVTAVPRDAVDASV